jgi:hypothetical protein
MALQVGGVSDETVKYGREFCGSSTQEWLFWQGLEAIVQVNCRPILSSERVPHIKKPAIVGQKTKIWSWAPDGSPTPRQTRRLTVGRKLTSTSTSAFKGLLTLTYNIHKKKRKLKAVNILKLCCD